MAIPKKLSRRTKHRSPRCQLYQPGFNVSNGCWLDGSWVTVPAEDFEELAKKHEVLYQDFQKQKAKQHYKNSGVSLENMTPAQQQAWEHYSGSVRYEVRYEDGGIGGILVDLAADSPSVQFFAWLREKKAKVIPKVLQPYGQDEEGKVKHQVVDQTNGIPADLLTDDAEPVDVWKRIVQQNHDQSTNMFKAMVETISTGGPESSLFAVMVAMQGLLKLEEDIIRLETNKHEDETLEEAKDRYRDLRSSLEGTLKDAFQLSYQASRESHNYYARRNLDSSNGTWATYVLPEFAADGSHEPVGPRDIPWGRGA